MKHLPPLAAFVLLSACGTMTTPPTRAPLPPVAEDSCNANQYSAVIGQDATALERILILSQVRVIRPGQAITMDFRPERINFDVDANERITSIYCG